ncbi:hypothetical protein J3F83DRAFT_673467 [Trichoderma novae-zelandiae]
MVLIIFAYCSWYCLLHTLGVCFLHVGILPVFASYSGRCFVFLAAVYHSQCYTIYLLFLKVLSVCSMLLIYWFIIPVYLPNVSNVCLVFWAFCS